MPISNRSDCRRWSRSNGATSRTAVYGPVRTVVWQGSAGDRCPYADQWILSSYKSPKQPSPFIAVLTHLPAQIIGHATRLRDFPDQTGAYGLVLAGTMLICFLQGFNVAGFHLDAPLLWWLGVATVCEMSGLLSLTVGHSFQRKGGSSPIHLHHS
jgi:hypothetical protein